MTSRELFALFASTTFGSHSGISVPKTAAPADPMMKLRRESSLYSWQPQSVCSDSRIAGSG